MSAKYTIRYRGPVFEGRSKDLISGAIRATLAYGGRVIADRTPVLTGALQAGWENDSETLIYNAVPYSLYVEDGTSRTSARRMAANSLPDIAQRLETELTQALRGLE